MSGHTPGPWAIVNREIRGPAESGVIVARIPEWGVAADDPDPFAANTRLIAAAPDLLEALKALMPILDNDGPLAAAYANVGPLVCAAIAKAEGRS